MSIYGDLVITPEEEAEIIEKVAQRIHKWEIETIAIFMLESSKPLVWVTGELGRFFVNPFIPIISQEWGLRSERFLRTFEQRENIEKLLKRVEELAEEAERRKEEEKKAKEASGKQPEETKKDP